jgi:xylulokinase
MHSLATLDANDQVLRPAILWNDQRTGAECREIEQTLGFDRLIALTGNRALTGFTAPKLLWLRRHEPEVFAQIARIALPKDYVRLRLCGVHATDVADASGTLLLDVAARRWSEEVIEALGLERSWFSDVLESCFVSGETADGVAVAAGAGDQAAGAVGVGVDSPGPVSIVLGTSGVVFGVLDGFEADPEARVHAFCHAIPETWHCMGVMLSAADSLRWLGTVSGSAGDFATLLEEATAWPAGTEGLLFLPYLAGERTPHADPDARGAFVGLSIRHDRGALVRAVLEGVAFALHDSLDLVGALAGAPTVARVSGGGARSELWLRILASVLELPLERVAVDEGAAFGAAILGGVAGGAWPDVRAATAATVHPRGQIEPVPEWAEVYRETRERLRSLYPALKDL